MRFTKYVWLSALAVGLYGCSAHDPLIVTNTTDVTQVAEKKYPPHQNKVFVTNQLLPESARYEVLGKLEVGKVWYGSSHKVLESLADGARELGADAVVEVKTWHQPSGWSWAAPHGSGKAVKIIDPSSVDFSALTGWWK